MFGEKMSCGKCYSKTLGKDLKNFNKVTEM